MKLVVNEKDECCVSINIEYTPEEALVINQAMRIYADDEYIHEDNRKLMKAMLNVKPVFREISKE